MITTDRLLLRRWRAADAAPFHAMGQDAEVMRYLGPPMSREYAADTVTRQNDIADAYGRCFWAIERRADRGGDGAFLGFCGVKPGPQATPIADLPEIGWRLRRDAWGQGYAFEAALACLADEWQRGTPEVFAITVPPNERSWRLMERLGMTRNREADFNHPALAPGDPLRAHITYRIAQPT